MTSEYDSKSLTFCFLFLFCLSKATHTLIQFSVAVRQPHLTLFNLVLTYYHYFRSMHHFIRYYIVKYALCRYLFYIYRYISNFSSQKNFEINFKCFLGKEKEIWWKGLSRHNLDVDTYLPLHHFTIYGCRVQWADKAKKYFLLQATVKHKSVSFNT